MIKMEHIRQSNDGYNWKCGAVCLEMLLGFYGIKCKQDDIWRKIKSKCSNGFQYYAKTYDLARCAIEMGLNTTIYKTNEKDCLQLLDFLDKENWPVIMSVLQKKSNSSHFVIYIGKKDGKYCFNDPDSDKDVKKYDYSEVREMWRQNERADVAGYIYLLPDRGMDVTTMHICHACSKEYPIIEVSDEWKLQPTICPHCDKLG